MGRAIELCRHFRTRGTRRLATRRPSSELHDVRTDPQGTVLVVAHLDSPLNVDLRPEVTAVAAEEAQVPRLDAREDDVASRIGSDHDARSRKARRGAELDDPGARREVLLDAEAQEVRCAREGLGWPRRSRRDLTAREIRHRPHHEREDVAADAERAQLDARALPGAEEGGSDGSHLPYEVALVAHDHVTADHLELVVMASGAVVRVERLDVGIGEHHVARGIAADVEAVVPPLGREDRAVTARGPHDEVEPPGHARIVASSGRVAWHHRGMRAGALVVLLGTTAVAACATSTPSRAPRGEDGRLEAKLAELERLHDWRSTVFATRPPNPPVPARAKPITGAVRLDAVRTIRAYHYRRGYTNADARERFDDFDPPFTPDGRLDGHVVPPEAELIADERDRVLRVLRELAAQERAYAEGGGKRPSLHCRYAPHHVVVLFDASDAPIAKLFVDFDCPMMTAVPSTPLLGGDDTTILSREQAATLQTIADRHGLGAWTYVHGPALDELATYARGRPPAQHPSGVPADVTPARATRDDRARFCVWLRAEMSDSAVGSFACPDGAAYRFSAEPPITNDCETAALCDVPFGRLEACLRASFLKGPEAICGTGLGPACSGLVTCLPYVAWKSR